MIVSDLDGTLMSPDHLTVSRRTVDALRQAHRKGVKIAVATGRPLALTDYVTRQLPFIDYVIYANGAGAYDRKNREQIYTNLIDRASAESIVKYFLSQKVFFDVYVDGRSCYQKSSRQYYTAATFPKGFVDYVEKTMDGYDSLADLAGSRGIEKITVYTVPDGKFEEFYGEMTKRGLEVSVSFENSIEATAANTNKAAAVAGICQRLLISPQEVMAFGDQGNDVCLMEYAGLSFAMENASEECKKSAKHITLSNAMDGVAAAVEKYI